MEKDQSFQGDNVDLQQEQDFMSAPAIMPVGKLDADEYSAEDMDGITESFFGSGNMSYLSMQSAELHDKITTTNGGEAQDNNADISNPDYGNNSISFVPADNAASLSFGSMQGDGFSQDDLQTLQVENPADVNAVIADGNFSNSTVGSISATSISINNSFSPSSYITMGSNDMVEETASTRSFASPRLFIANGNGDDEGNEGDNEQNTTNNNETTNSSTVTNYHTTNVHNNTYHGDITNINVTNISNQTTNNLINNTVNNINSSTMNLGDTVNNITNTVNHILNGGNDGNTTGDVIGAVTNVVNNVLQSTVNVLNQTTSNLTDLLNGSGKLAINLDGNLLSTVDAHVGVVVDNTIHGGVNANVITTPLTDYLHQSTGLSLPVVNTLLNGVGANIGFNLLNGGAGTSNAAGDSDLTIHGLDQLGIHLPNINLDAVEGLVGDVDIDVNLPNHLLDPATLLSNVQQTLESLNDLHIAPLANILEPLGGEGLTGALGIELLDHTLTQPLNLELGQVTSPVVDVLNGLTQTLTPQLNCIVGGLASQIPAQNLVPDILRDVGNGFSHILSDLAHAGQDAGDTTGNVVADLGQASDLPSVCELPGDIAATVHTTSDIANGLVNGILSFGAVASANIIVADTLQNVGGTVHSLTQDIAQDTAHGLGNVAADLGGVPCDLTNPCELTNDIGHTVHDAVALTGAIVDDVASSAIIAPVQTIVADTLQNVGGTLHDMTQGIAQDTAHGLGNIAADVGAVPCDLSNPCELTNDVTSTVHDVAGMTAAVVSNVAAPIDSSLHDALDTLAGNVGGALNQAAEGLQGAWTETSAAHGGLFGDIISSSHLGDMLPDPVSGVAEGLGALDITHNTHHHSGGLGGLFG